MNSGKAAGFLISAAVFAAILVGPSLAVCGDAGKLVSKGNENYRGGDYPGALGFYEKASVEKPESPIIHFNKGGALYKSGDYQGAAEEFRAAAGKTRELPLEARSWYNLGNCSFMGGRRQTDSDMEKALESYRESVDLYQTALEKDSTLTDAAVNIEVARLVIKDLLDKIKEQREKMDEQREKMKEIVDSLLSIAEDQSEAIERGRDLSEEKKAGSSDWREGTGGLEKKQKAIREKARKTGEKLREMAEEQVPPPIQQAVAHVDSSLAAQDEAAGELSGLMPENAAEGQTESLEQIMKAVEALTDNQSGQQDKDQEGEGDQSERKDQQPPEDQKEQREQETKRKGNETAQDILAEEKENREKRRESASSGYRRVDKDW